MFDLATDPNERTNLIGNPYYTDEQHQLSTLAKQKWDIDELTEKVKLSQARRLFLKQVLRIGTPPDWDYVSPDPVAEHCLRGTKIYNQWAYGGSLGLHIPSDKEQD